MRQIERARRAAEIAEVDALLISPGADLRYLIGYDALLLERLTCLVIPAAVDPFLVVPELELPAAHASLGPVRVEIVAWADTVDPYELIRHRLPGNVGRILVDNHMWAEKVLALQAALPRAHFGPANTILGDLRMRKTAQEIASLRAAGAAIDRVHAEINQWLSPGRTERQVARDIADAMLQSGHARADFVIVGSGPNSASPHHEASDRMIGPGEPVVVDISGTMPDGYRSDSTRTYSIGAPPAEFLAYYEVLLAAQSAQVATAQPGITAGELDAVGRDIITAAGYGPNFLHRTGHGIGLDVHEDPYIVAGSPRILATGMAFSIEPGIYFPGRHGARIEDIVICTDDGVETLNNTPRQLRVL
ncbi:Xaa-Pro peptidase family protein [Hamadaea sp. NPDC050747]|uniref:M24 family metallopeptidase n=1 Tax=Hamadaea sp. NPDC050747 TaxID=3155789 RepID=UPI0033D19604